MHGFIGENLSTLDFDVISLQSGRREMQWHKNCLCLGRAASQLEPLDGAYLHLAQQDILRFIRLFPISGNTPLLMDEFNREACEKLMEIRNWFCLHYWLNGRSDTPFWREYSTIAIPESLKREYELHRLTGISTSQNRDFRPIVQGVMVAQGGAPDTYHPLIDSLASEQLDDFVKNIAARHKETLATFDSAQAFIAKNCQTSPFALAACAQVKAFQTGNAKTPVLVVDDLMDDIENTRNYAIHQADFEKEIHSYYPGVRALLPKAYIDSVLNYLVPQIQYYYGIDRKYNVRIRAAFFSMVSKPEEDLDVQQCIPHYDNTLINSFAIMHYLNPGEFGGTGYFRHKPTGIELVTNANQHTLQDSVNAFFRNHGAPDKKYIRDSNEQYTLMYSIPYRQNRLLVYPSGLLHSGLIKSDRDIGDNPATARLSANIFVELHCQ